MLKDARETVTIVSFASESVDALGMPVKSETEQDVDGVLVAIGSQKDATAANRPEGVSVTYTLYFPKTFTGDLRGCDVIVRGHRCHVIGNPDRWASPKSNPYNMVCEVGDVEG